MPTKFHLRAYLVQRYITLAYLATLIQNAFLAALGLIVALSIKGTLPSGNFILLLFAVAFLKSIVDQLSNGKDSAVLQMILQILQLLLQKNNIQPPADLYSAFEGRNTLKYPCK